MRMAKMAAGQAEKLEKVFCNRCGRELKVEGGILKEGCFSAEPVFGYFSNKDGEKHKFDLCEQCYDEIAAQFKIPVEVSEETEILGV